MAERAALEREIEELQNLIMDHKRVHGDAPSSSAQWFSSRCNQGGGRGSSLCYNQSLSGQHQPHSHHTTRYWRKTYSLNNKTTRPHEKVVSQFSNSNLNKTQQTRPVASGTSSLEGGRNVTGIVKVAAESQSCRRSTAPSCTVSGNASSSESNRPPVNSVNRTVLKSTRPKGGNVDLAKTASAMDSTQFCLLNNAKVQAASQSASTMVSCRDTLSASSSKETSAFNTRDTLAQPPMNSHVTSSSLASRTVIMAPSDSSAQAPAPLVRSSASNLRPKRAAGVQVATSCSSHGRSRFIWVKCEGTGFSQPKPATRSAGHSPNSAPAASTGVANIKQAISSNKKPHRRPGLSPGAPKTSAYSWVSSSCSMTTVAKAASLAKLPNKPPRAIKMPCKVGKEGLEGAKKLAFVPLMTPKRAKASGNTPTSQVNHTSRYCWKAAVQNPSQGVGTSTSKCSQKASVYQWTAQKRDPGSSLGPLSSRVQHSSPTPPLPGGGIMLRSRTTINKKYSSGLTPERRSSLSVVTVRSRYSMRRRTHTPVKSPSGGRRGQARVLVSYGRHKLRLSSSSSPAPAAWSPKTGSFAPSGRSPAHLRVFKTRYKIDTRRAPHQLHSPALSYRLKRIQSARMLLQSRVRTPPDRPWRGRDMRWIGGALYRVSANKLSRTQATSTPSYRSAKWFSPQDESSPSSVVRTSSMRHVASRAVQRSLAIIRHARQRKQQARHYCMYYNRFGKCNRADACPYIHDPEKVAVCTRFLRGTCKQTDGTCPFSHKVSKEKMPVCSYFLKGICSNSNCPYSHVYVSRKAAVCQDFLRGYCPQGEKCKKKHTLVCPEFSSTGVCPRGSKCKLQHRRRDKRPGSSSNTTPAKRIRSRDVLKRTETDAAETEGGTESSGPAKLPSFISLCSSPDPPESAERPICPPGAGQEATGKKLHIKPRFSSLN
ncbi:zinc finger CCCH domain-containing protein 3 isoform X2 [Brachyhypopomus gauderio]|uniref:zinc finger CCCH domain-containing protein 3 isoform X2 n=1 Tax=Brachyhypopomus gauderio TaxID=698409 RepID=UPI00404332E0